MLINSGISLLTSTLKSSNSLLRSYMRIMRGSYHYMATFLNFVGSALWSFTPYNFDIFANDYDLFYLLK
jgi:hypothetical protein